MPLHLFPNVFLAHLLINSPISFTILAPFIQHLCFAYFLPRCREARCIYLWYGLGAFHATYTCGTNRFFVKWIEGKSYFLWMFSWAYVRYNLCFGNMGCLTTCITMGFNNLGDIPHMCIFIRLYGATYPPKKIKNVIWCHDLVFLLCKYIGEVASRGLTMDKSVHKNKIYQLS